MSDIYLAMALFDKKLKNPDFGNEKSFRDFFDSHYSFVYRRLYSLLGDSQLSEELCQDIFVSLWQRRFELPAIESWNSYLLKSATFKAIDYRRKRKDILKFAEDIDAEGIIAEVEESKDEDIQLELLDKEIAALPDRCQMIFKLSRFENMSYAEIAKTLDISPKTVENQIGKALKILRKNLLPQLFFGLLQIFQ
ncbi:RNA polymerase sigma-70 factor [Aquiflexum sp. TKW24L]|uniref:RNA polymerase sigma factor n=1 Tax=Aquiflexum sp. TKW24L TaxID=2942212 RepID=UPI0020C07F52|nr:RNA polymerase sigma-70 factor [Aquiflexum sp. TKW24L]